MKKLFGKTFLFAALGCAVAGLALAGCGETGEKPVDHEHVYGEWTALSPATCEQNGLRTHTCAVCGESDEEEIPALGHDWDGGRETVTPTCSTEGERTVTCRRCQKKQVSVLPTVAHNWDAGKTIKAPTCQEEGLLLLTCSVCNATQNVSVGKSDHHYQILSTTEATCDREGSVQYSCAICGAEDTETLPALGHRWTAGATDQAATCTEPGRRDRHCTRCNATEQSEIPPLGHSWEGEFTVDVAPTFTSEGSKSYHCTRCGAHGTVTPIPKLQENVPIDYEFRVLRNNGSLLLNSDIKIAVYDGDVKVAECTRSTLINGVFTAKLNPKTYTVKATNLPEGYTAEASYSVEASDPRCKIYLTASPIAEAPARTTRYSVGSVLHDFTLPSIYGQPYTLSEILQEKKAVVLNFWATWCGPCQMEFGYLREAYQLRRDEIEVLAVDDAGTNDNLQGVKQFANSYGLTFPVIFDEQIRLANMFGVSSYPTTVVIDGEGVVCEIHVGAIPSTEQFLNLFDPYLSDGYLQNHSQKTNTVLLSATECVLPDKRALGL